MKQDHIDSRDSHAQSTAALSKSRMEPITEVLNSQPNDRKPLVRIEEQWHTRPRVGS